MVDFFISINLTNRCNLGCKYCIAESPYNQIYDNITLSNINFIVYMINKYLSDLKIFILLVGGEPLLHPYINNILDTLRNNIKNLVYIYICTNGTLPIEKIIKNHTLLYYSITYHADIIENMSTYQQNFINNLKFIKIQKIKNILKVISIKNNKVNINNLYSQQIQEIKSLNEDVIYPHIISNSHFSSNIINNNQFYNQNVYYHRGINITRNILYNKEIKYVLSYLCDMDNPNKYKSIYSVKEWMKLVKHINDIILCTKEICICDVSCVKS